MYILISAIVQEHGADWKFKKASDPDKPKELELKIQKIDLFREVKDSLIDSLTLTLPLQQLDEDLLTELSDMVLSNKGNVNLYMHVVDENSPNKVKLFSRQNRMKLDQSVYRKLKAAKSQGKLDFVVNQEK